MTKLNWTGRLAAVIFFAVILPAPALRTLGARGGLVAAAAIAIAALLGVIQYVQISLQDRRGNEDARRLRSESEARSERSRSNAMKERAPGPREGEPPRA